MLIKKTKFSLNTLFYSIIVMAGVAQAASQPITDYGNTPQLWRQKLTQLNNGDDVVFRVLQLGDSHTAGAFFTDELRNRLQQRWGNAGIGWVFPQQISGQRNTQIRYQGTWKTLTSRKERADFPLGGVLARSQKADILTLHSNQAQGKQRITFAMRPILANGALTVRGAEGEHTPAYGLHGNVWQYFSLDATFPLQFQAQDNELWELGAINIENGQRGVIVSGLGLNGAQLSQWAAWRKDWTQDLAETQADLVILAYGTNEAFNANLDIAATEQRWRDSIRQIRDTLPNAAILIVGAPESLIAKQGTCGTRPKKLDQVQNMQQQLAQSEGVLYWSWQTAMGGACTMNKWVQQGLAAKDGVHFNGSGYRQTAQQLADALYELTTQTPTEP